MRKLKIENPEKSILELSELMKSTKSVRVFRRIQALKGGIELGSLKESSKKYDFSYIALVRWYNRYKVNGLKGLEDKPIKGRTRKITKEVEDYIEEIVLTKAPLDYGGIYPQWICREIGMVLEAETGLSLSAESIRQVLKKKNIVITDQQKTLVHQKKK